MSTYFGAVGQTLKLWTMWKGEDGKTNFKMERWGIMDLKLIQTFLVASLFTVAWFAVLIWLLFQYMFLISINFSTSNVEDNSNLQLTKQATVQPSRTTTTYVRSSVHYAPLFVCLCFCVVIFFCIVKRNLLCVVLRVDINEQHSAGGATMAIISWWRRLEGNPTSEGGPFKVSRDS